MVRQIVRHFLLQLSSLQPILFIQIDKTVKMWKRRMGRFERTKNQTISEKNVQ